MTLEGCKPLIKMKSNLNWRNFVERKVRTQNLADCLTR